MKRLTWIFSLLLALIAATPASAQTRSALTVPTCADATHWVTGAAGALTVLPDGSLCISGTISTSTTGFPTLQSTGTPISVTTGGVTGTLPTGAVVVATNVGTTNGAYCKLGASATTSDQYIAPNGGWFAFTVGAATQLTCITSTSTTTVNMVGGSGLPTGTGGGGGGSGGAVTMASGAVASGAYASGAFASGSFASGSHASGSFASGAFASGSVASGALASGSIASGAMVDLGSQADSVCGTATGTCSLIALQKYNNNSTNAGTGATAAAVPASGIFMGGRAASAAPTEVTDGQLVGLQTSLGGKLVNLPYSIKETVVSGGTAAMTGTTSTSVIASAGGSLRNYITACTFSNSHATVGTMILLQDGSGGTTLWAAPAAAVFGGAHIVFPTPIKTTAATALFTANVTTGANTFVYCTGYTGL